MVYLAQLVRLLFSIYIILIIVRVFFAWIRPNMFNPIVRFVYTLTDPYLKIFAGFRFLRIGYIDLSPILALFFLYFMSELSYNVILRGYFSIEMFARLAIILFFRFFYFIIFIFIIAVGLRFILEIVGVRTNNMFASIVYSISEPAVRPIRRLLRMSTESFDISSAVSLAILILMRYLILPRIQHFILMAIG